MPQARLLAGLALATTAVNRLLAMGGRYALCTTCIGVGQGIAVILERCNTSINVNTIPNYLES